MEKVARMEKVVGKNESSVLQEMGIEENMIGKTIRFNLFSSSICAISHKMGRIGKIIWGPMYNTHILGYSLGQHYFKTLIVFNILYGKNPL